MGARWWWALMLASFSVLGCRSDERGQAEAPVVSVQPDDEETTVTTAASEPAIRSVPDGAFLALRVGGEILVVDAASGAVLATVVVTSEDREVTDIALGPDRDVIYVTTAAYYRGDEQLLRVALDGSTEVIGDGDRAALSPMGTQLAVGVYRDDGGPMVRVLNLDGEVERELLLDTGDGSGDLSIRGIEWLDPERLVIEAGHPEAGSQLFILSLDDGSTRRLGPPVAAIEGTGWYSGQRYGDGLLLLESCCALDANSYRGDTHLLAIDPDTGAELRREPVFDEVWAVSAGPDGRLVAIGSPDEQTASAGLLVAGTWHPIDRDQILAVDW